MKIKCLPRIRGVPTSFYKLNMMFSTNQGTPQDYSSLHQIKAVAHILIYIPRLYPYPIHRTNGFFTNMNGWCVMVLNVGKDTSSFHGLVGYGI